MLGSCNTYGSLKKTWVVRWLFIWNTGVLGKLYYVRFADENSSGSVVVFSFRDSVFLVLSYGRKEAELERRDGFF